MKKNWKVLKTENDYQEALSRLDMVIDAELGTDDGDELELIAVLIKDYEDRYYPVKLPDPIEMIKLRMAETGLKNKDLVDIIGSESHVSSILSGKRQITLEMARKLSKKLNIRASIFINDDISFESYEEHATGNKLHTKQSARKSPASNSISTSSALQFGKLQALFNGVETKIDILQSQIKDLQKEIEIFSLDKTA